MYVLVAPQSPLFKVRLHFLWDPFTSRENLQKRGSAVTNEEYLEKMTVTQSQK